VVVVVVVMAVVVVVMVMTTEYIQKSGHKGICIYNNNFQGNNKVQISTSFF